MSPSLLLHLLLLLSFVVYFSCMPSPFGAQCNLATIYGLKTADCMNLDLTSVPRTLDSDLKTLNFHGNRLTFLEIDTFVVYPSLQNLYLVRNGLEAVAPDAFRELQNLQILDLEGNKLTTIPGLAFVHLPSLRFLSLRSNPISYVTNADLVFLKNIEVINLENCWLTRIEPRAFAELSRLYELNVVNNELQGLSTEMAETLAPGLTILRLHSNPWQCDCRLRWLRVLVARVPNWDFGQNTPTCAGPELLRGVTWKQLVPEQFACPSMIVGNSTTVRELVVGANASIECVVFGDPQPSVTWMKGSRFVADDLISQNTVTSSSSSSSSSSRHESARQDKLVRSVVTLYDVTQADANDYKCIAVNTAGRSEVTYMVWVSGSVGGAKHLPDSMAGVVFGAEMMLGMAVTSVGFVCVLLTCVTCAVMRIRAKARINRKLPELRLKTIPTDEVGPSPTEDSFSSSGSGSLSSTSGARNSFPAFDGAAVALDEDNVTTTTTWTPQRNSLHGECRGSTANHLQSNPPIVRSVTPEPDSAVEVQIKSCVPSVVPLEPEPKNSSVVVPVSDVPDDSITPDLLSDKHVINFRSDRNTDTDAVVEPPSRVADAVCVGSGSSALANSITRSDVRTAGVSTLDAKPPPAEEITESLRYKRVGSAGVKSFCDNPICLRERMYISSSPGEGRGRGGGAGNGRGHEERLLPVTGHVCSHRMALRKGGAQTSAIQSATRGRPTGSPSFNHNRAYSGQTGAPYGFNHPKTNDSHRDRHREHRRSRDTADTHPSYSITTNPGSSRIWASQHGDTNIGLLGAIRGGVGASGSCSKTHSTRVPPAFYLRSSSSRLDRAEEFEDPLPVTLNRRQTFSSMSLNDILSPPFGISATPRQSGSSKAQRMRTSNSRETQDDQCGTAV